MAAERPAERWGRERRRASRSSHHHRSASAIHRSRDAPVEEGGNGGCSGVCSACDAAGERRTKSRTPARDDDAAAMRNARTRHQREGPVRFDSTRLGAKTFDRELLAPLRRARGKDDGTRMGDPSLPLTPPFPFDFAPLPRPLRCVFGPRSPLGHAHGRRARSDGGRGESEGRASLLHDDDAQRVILHSSLHLSLRLDRLALTPSLVTSPSPRRG